MATVDSALQNPLGKPGRALKSSDEIWHKLLTSLQLKGSTARSKKLLQTQNMHQLSPSWNSKITRTHTTTAFEALQGGELHAVKGYCLALIIQNKDLSQDIKWGLLTSSAVAQRSTWLVSWIHWRWMPQNGCKPPYSWSTANHQFLSADMSISINQSINKSKPSVNYKRAKTEKFHARKPLLYQIRSPYTITFAPNVNIKAAAGTHKWNSHKLHILCIARVNIFICDMICMIWYDNWFI